MQKTTTACCTNPSTVSSDERRRDGHEMVGGEGELPHDQTRRRVLPQLILPKENA